MKRKEEYNKKVQGKVGGLDLVQADLNAEFVINKAGAKVYKDLSKHNELEIPSLNSDAENGKVYDVLSIGIMPPGVPIATIKIGDLPVAFRLPSELVGWCKHSMGLAMQGVKIFPAEVEFGFLNGRYYAELV
jgi:hypothetical protein